MHFVDGVLTEEQHDISSERTGNYRAYLQPY